MEEDRSHLAKRPASRVRSKAKESAKPRRSSSSVACGPRRAADAGAGALKEAEAMVEVVRRAAVECDGEVEPGVSMLETLSNPDLRASAAKWRSGSDSRRVTALFARLMNGLHTIRPAWLENIGGNHEPSPVRPLPVAEALHGPMQATNWVAWKAWILSKLHKRTLVLGLVLLCFPKICALVATTVMRLVFRALLALASRILAEFGKEVKEILWQVSWATSSTEDSVMHFLEELMFRSEASTSEAVPLMSSPSTVDPPSTPCPHHPSPPWSFVSCLLLVADLALRLRPMAGAGGP